MLTNTTTGTVYANDDDAYNDMQFLLSEYGQRVCIVDADYREVYCNRADH